MTSLIRLLQKLDYIRLVVGICILIDGYPLIFFFRDTLRFATGSTVFTALGFAGGLVLMVPFTVFRRLYRFDVIMFWTSIAFIAFSIFYMYVYPPLDKVDYTREMIYYAFIIIFLFLLINIPNDIIPVVVPVIVFFTLASNLGLVYSLVKDPSWVIGQRATIVLNDSDDGSGNPHVFARNAFMGIVACMIWLVRPQTNFLVRLLALFSGIFSVVVLVLTQTRSSVVALGLAIILFVVYNVRPTQIRTAVRGIFKPGPLIVIAIGIVGLVVFFNKYSDLYYILESYVYGFIERNLETVYGALGLTSKGADYKAVIDDSVANRTGNLNLLTNTLTSQAYMLIPGYGYKFSYIDIPMLEAFTNQGILGLILFGGVTAMSVRHSLRVMRTDPNDLNTFLAYFYVLIFVYTFTGGRPYDITFWFPLALMTRFMGVEHLFPSYLSKHPVETSYLVVKDGDS
ncbi:hypothetical protein IC230_20690 [Spirosoma sp. BT704]|uniref:Uncharacterized protein n=1 Tax=Spirosoma validum TaxID=2771355 RepID=A0A927B482_9BACT|nr:hypothetical protein [Spirosoma validum]